MRGVVGKHKKVSLQELIASQIILLYAYQKINEVDDADIADGGEEWEEEDCDTGVEETKIEPPPKKNRGGRPSKKEKEMQKLLEDERANNGFAEGTSSHSCGEEECRTISVLCDPR